MKGSQLKVSFNGGQSVLPRPNAELKTGTVASIKKPLGRK
jgi:predicted RNA binding protein YcfA (HicA-like mRNA interferase family)